MFTLSKSRPCDDLRLGELWTWAPWNQGVAALRLMARSSPGLDMLSSMVGLVLRRQANAMAFAC